MSLNERIFSLETEYGVQFYSDLEFGQPTPQEQVAALVEAVADDYGTPDVSFLINGSKFHHDVGHPEWSLPECRTAREATIYDQAADQVLRSAIPRAEEKLAQSGFHGQLVVFKNNFDSAGKTFGCHENYLMTRDAVLLGGRPFLRYLIRCLVPFLVSRQILCGAGMLKFDDEGGMVFHISQRAGSTTEIASRETRFDRGIVNLGRENESLSSEAFRRLHLILGDSNLSGWSTWIKLGTTGLLLRLVEDLFMVDLPLLADPVDALNQVANDVGCTQTILLRDGRRMKASDIQWQYYKAISEYVDEFGCSVEEESILQAWQQALEDIESNPLLLGDRADWAIKKSLIDANLKRMGGTWRGWKADPESISSLRALDLTFHDLRPSGYFSRLQAADLLASVDEISADEIQNARSEPPPYTRANIRGSAIERARANLDAVYVGTWTDLELNELSLDIPDALQFAHFAMPETFASVKKALNHESPEVRLRAVTYVGGREMNLSLRTLSEMVTGDPDERVRRAAVKAIGRMDGSDKLPALIECLRDKDAHIRWIAEESLRNIGTQTSP